MVRKLIEWAVNSPLVVILLALALAGVGGFAFYKVNVEAYPDPAPAIVEVVAQNPGASAEEMERLVTIPIEVALANMPGIQYTRSKSLFGLSHLRLQFEYGIDYERAKQEVINRLQLAQLPAGVTPQISPASPTGEVYRYTLTGPRDTRVYPEDVGTLAAAPGAGFPATLPWVALARNVRSRDIYTLNDLKALQDFTLQREFLRVPRIAGVVSSGGTVKRYEIHLDPDRLKQYGVTLQQVQSALASSNVNVSGDLLVEGDTVQVVRGIGLIGGGQDPMQHVLAMRDPREAAAYLRSEEERRIREIRSIVIKATNNKEVLIDQLVEGGPLRPGSKAGKEGVVVAHQTRLGRVSISHPAWDRAGRLEWHDDDDKVQAIVLLRKGQESLPALRDVQKKIEELNQPGRLPPGIKIEPYYNRTALIDVTTETVQENLITGMALVTLILLLFLGNVRTAVIVALNIPLALLFAFFMLWVRGRSANLLSIGAVDFGIIVDSSVIMVEGIYRHLRSGEHAELTLKERIVRASAEVERSLFFSTVIMVCALLPLFTMQGPEGQIFGPMADTYAFALGGALILALTLSPALCLVCFSGPINRMADSIGAAATRAVRVVYRNFQPGGDNLLVRGLKTFYLRQLRLCLNYRWLALGIFGLLVMETVAVVPFMGREFMPELEEGNVYVRATFPVNVSLDRVTTVIAEARKIMRSYAEVEAVVAQIGRPDDGTDPTGFYNVEIHVPLKPEKDWPIPPGRDRPRTKPELIKEMKEELSAKLIGIDWDFSQYIRDNVMEALSGVKGENSVKIFGPDLDELERIAQAVENAITPIPGIQDAGVFRIKGQSNLEFPFNRRELGYWGIPMADATNVIKTAIGGQPFTQMTEGEKTFDIIIRWPKRLRRDETAIKQIPVDVNNAVTPGYVPGLPGTTQTAPSTGVSTIGTSAAPPAALGSIYNANVNNPAGTPQRRLGDLVTPLDARGRPDPKGQLIKPGASTISREQGNRFIAVKFGVRGRDLASTVAEAQAKIAPLLPRGYSAVWSGEFQEMEEAEHRLVLVVSISLVLILILLYLAFRSLLDALVVFANVVAMSLGGIWALVLTGTNFNISAAVGFISILGVAVMNGLLLVSAFNHLRTQGLSLRDALLRGVEKLVRPITMTALAAILGLLPAALSTRIGSQSQQPLAIVVVGGMIATLLTTNLVPVLYSFYGHREPRNVGDGLVH
jgi:cobalt-zinc-cadmium resistance protein CzcA